MITPAFILYGVGALGCATAIAILLGGVRDRDAGDVFIGIIGIVGGALIAAIPHLVRQSPCA